MRQTTRQAKNNRLPRTGRGNMAHGIAPRFGSLELLDPRLLLSGSVFVTVLHDLNGNGIKDLEEPPLEGWDVYVDLDRNGIHDAGEPLATTNIDGEATITGVAKGTWDVVEVLPAGWAPSPGFKVFDRASVNDNKTTDVLFLNVTAANGGIDGTVWNDLNNDGVRDAADAGLPGWTVFLDLNANRVLDPLEPAAITDANGHYVFPDLAPGTYRVREITPAGWSLTLGFDNNVAATVSPATSTVVDFGNFSAASLGSIGGTVWNDVNADGNRAAGDSGLAGWTVFLDLNGDGILEAPAEPSAITDALGVYSFPSVAAGNYQVAEVLQPDWNLSPGHPVAVNVPVVGENKSTVDFANWTLTLGSITGTVWNDLNGDGLMTGEPGIAGWTVFIDQNSDGLLNAGEPSVVSDSLGNYTLAGVSIGAQLVRDVPAVGWQPTAPGTGVQLVNMLNGSDIAGINFGNQQRTDSAIGGRVFADSNHNGVRDAGERGLPGITVYFDTNNNGALDAGESSMVTSADLFYTPAVDEAGTYQFTHLAGGDYQVREILPAELSATLPANQAHPITLLPGENRANVDFADRYRLNEIHGVKFNDLNGNQVRDPGEPGMSGITVYVDLNRDDVLDPSEPSTVTGPDGSYSFTGLTPGAYVVREIEPPSYEHTYPTTTGGILWPAGVSNPAIGNVTPTSITTSLAAGQSFHQTVSLTLPGTGALTNMVDVFLLFDDTGSFTANSPIVRAAFPQIISSLQAALPGTDLGFGVGRFEEYANFASEFGTGRPFILNQPIVASSTAGFAAAIQAALDRTAPGYGGDQPETDIEALFQLVTGRGFDGNNNGSLLDSGAAGLVSTQLTPGVSGDVPPFASFTAAGPVLPAAGTIGGGGFRAGALPIILTATDTGFAYQPRGETSITGLGGLTLPLSALTQTSRPTTPFNSGAGIQETVTALNALGALVIGLGTNSQTTLDPRQDLESLARLTGAINQTATTIANGTLIPIAPGDPFYFQIASGFATSVANGVVSAIQNAATNVAVNVTLQASDPRVHIISLPGVVPGVGAGQTATFDVEFVGDGIPHRFDLQFVREGTNVVLGSIPVVLGTPVPGVGYEFEDLPEGEIHNSSDFGGHSAGPSSSVAALPAAATSAAFPVAWSAAGGGSGTTYDVLVSDNGGPYTLWMIHTFSTQAVYSGESFHKYDFYSVASDSFGTTETPHATADASTLVAAVDGTSGDDALLLRLDPADTTMLQVFRTAAPVGAPAYSVPLSQVPLLTINPGAGNDTLNIDGPVSIPLTVQPGAGTKTVNVLSGTQTFSSDLGQVGLDVQPGSSVTFGTTQHLKSLSIGADASAGFAAGTGKVLFADGLSIGGTGAAMGQLDLADSELVLGYSTPSAYDSVRQWVQAGTLTGRGIFSSTVPVAPASTIALADNAMIHQTTWNGQTISDGSNFNQILTKRTLLGDANLDGAVDGQDYLNIIANMGRAGATYLDGDLNFDGLISPDDFAVVAASLGGPAGPPLLVASAARPASIPASAPARRATKKPAPHAKAAHTHPAAHKPVSIRKAPRSTQ